MNELKLELSMDKTKITHLGTEYAKFLGYYIKTIGPKEGSQTRRVDTNKKYLHMRKSTGKPKLLVPLKYLRNQLIKLGFANVKGKPKYVGKFLYLSDYEIVQRYNSVLRGYMNFYNMAENRSKLGELIYILEFSLIHTLAAKHRTEIRKIIQRYGKPIKVTIGSANKQKTVIFDKPENLKAEYLNKKYQTLKKP
jgi:hypothetical protein